MLHGLVDDLFLGEVQVAEGERYKRVPPQTIVHDGGGQ